jgi:hypothetical protein
VTLNPVVDGDTDNGLSATTLGVNTGGDGSMVYLRFDLSSLPANAFIGEATLGAYAYDGFAYGGDGTVYTYLVPDDTWAATDLTTNPPAATGSALGSWWLWTAGGPAGWGTTATMALAEAIQSKLAGDKLISFQLSSPGYWTSYYPVEDTAEEADWPYLTLVLCN